MQESTLSIALSLAGIVISWMTLLVTGLIFSTLERTKYKFIVGGLILVSIIGFLFSYVVFIDPTFLEDGKVEELNHIGHASE